MTISNFANRRNAFAATVLMLAGFAVPAVAGDKPQSYQDNVTPMSASQSAMLRHGAPANGDIEAAAPASASMPATRSQIEVLDQDRARESRMALASH
jgi:hypothetical protein